MSPEEQNELEGEITLEEAGKALKNMKNGKSPGTDGFTPEIFKFFWRQLGSFVVRALNKSFREGQLTSTQREGIIISIPKGDRPRHLIKNWRPISLLNTVYKIGSSCIANRIKSVLPNLISDDQTGFMKNRFIGDNIRLIYDIIDYLNSKQRPGMLICIDFEKAFDSLDWGFMLKTMKSFGFGSDICHWIETFHKDIKTTVIVNGESTDWFSILRGCRQGDPISPYLFILSAEILGIMIRENKNIKGIQLKDLQHKISQFADDTQLLNEGDRTSFEETMEALTRFGNASGLELNIEKTKIIWLGNRTSSTATYMPHLKLNWNPSEFKILGIWFATDLQKCNKMNFDEKFKEIRTLFNLWIRRNITPLGRVAVLKSLILSKLVHLWLLLPNPPTESIEKLQKDCFKFVWNNKQDRISRKTTVKHIKEGGLGIPSLKHTISALKLSWIRKTLVGSKKMGHIIAGTLSNHKRVTQLWAVSP